MNPLHRNFTVSGFPPLLALMTGLVAVPLSYAGPGIQYWRQSGDTKADTAAKVQTVTQACSGCSGMKSVDLTTTKHDWPNGRGPLQTVVIGSEQVCRACAAPSFAMRPAWSNGRGPLQAVAVDASHVCQTTLTAANR